MSDTEEQKKVIEPTYEDNTQAVVPDIKEEDKSKSENNGLENMFDDDDEEEEEEEEEIEEDESPKKKKHKSAFNFVDVEAEVSGEEDEEEEDEDELIKEGFITKEGEGSGDDEDDPSGKRSDALHRQLDAKRSKIQELENEKIAAEFTKRHKQNAKRAAEQLAAYNEGFIPQRFLLPSVDTAIIWGVRCRPGQEKALIRKLFLRKQTLDANPQTKNLKIWSIFQRDSFPGRIYIESPKAAVVEKFLKGVPDIYFNQKILVPVQELPSLLSATKKANEVEIESDSYVRIRSGIYKNDLAKVLEVSPNKLSVLLKIVPRIVYEYEEEDLGNGKRKRKTINAANRPPQALFNPTLALRSDPNNYSMRNDIYIFRNEEYDDGYLIKEFKINRLITENIIPTVDELTKLNGKSGGDLDLATVSMNLRKAQQANSVFQTGDTVEILSGEQKGSKAVVQTLISASIVLVKLFGFNQPSEYPSSTLRKIFQTGDHVAVINGDHNGDSGLVLNINNGQVTFVSNQTKKNITVTANNLKKSIDSTPTSNEYVLHDIVTLSNKTTACVIEAGHDIFKVKDVRGKVSTITKATILNKIETTKSRNTTIDYNGREVEIGDSVMERVGARREGQVLYILQNELFILSRNIIEDSGVFIVSSHSIEAIGSKEDENNQTLNLSQMNPEIIRQQQKQRQRMEDERKNEVRFGRDVALGKTVTIKSQGYKGQLGRVKDVTGDRATIELYSSKKNIVIDKRKLNYMHEEGGRSLSYDELVNKRGSINRSNKQLINPSSSFVSRNNQFNNKAEIPSFDNVMAGGQTPGWGAMNGGKTPAVGAGRGAGGATAYGGSSIWAAANSGNATTRGSSSTWNAGNASTWNAGNASTWNAGNASTWGATGGTSTWGGNNASGGASAWAKEGGQTSYGNTSSWGGNKSAWGGAPAQQGGNASTWGANANTGNTSTWGSSTNNNNNSSSSNNNNNNGNTSTWGQ
ncbi:hypothetical protein ACO0SA_003964 [Hanseniaspora valbyensis]